MNDNAIVIEAWNTVLFDKFVRFKHQLINGLSNHSNEVLKRGLFPTGARVLDVGMGFGDSTLQIARQVGPTGEAVGGLLATVAARLRALEPIVELFVPYDRGDVIAALHREGEVLVEVHDAGGTRVRARLPRTEVTRFGTFVVAASERSPAEP